MATHHETQESGGGVWKAINAIIALGFGGFAAVAGGALIYGGIIIVNGGDTKPAEAPVAAIAPAAAPTAAGETAATPAVPAPAAGPAQEVTIKPDATNPLLFDTKAFTVKAGQAVKLTFDNPKTSPLQHNLIIGKLGSKDSLNAGAMAIGSDPEGMAKGYVFDSPDILVHSKLLSPGQTEVIEFTAPTEPGEYPYLCSFPGHYLMMNGVMKVE